MEKTVDEYLMQFKDEKKDILCNYRKIILNSSIELREKISWGMPSYYINKYIIHFAGHKNHVGIYAGKEVVKVFENKLTGLNYSKGTIQIKYTDEIPKELIEEIIKYNTDKDRKYNKK